MDIILYLSLMPFTIQQLQGQGHNSNRIIFYSNVNVAIAAQNIYLYANANILHKCIIQFIFSHNFLVMCKRQAAHIIFTL